MKVIIFEFLNTILNNNLSLLRTKFKLVTQKGIPKDDSTPKEDLLQYVFPYLPSEILNRLLPLKMEETEFSTAVGSFSNHQR